MGKGKRRAKIVARYQRLTELFDRAYGYIQQHY